VTEDPRIAALPDIHGHAKGEHKPFAEERPIPYTARMLFLWFYHACRRGSPRFLMVADHMNYLTFEDPAAVNLVRRALKLAQAGDLYGAAETAGVDLGHAQIVSEGLRKGIRYSIGAEVDNDPRCRPDAQNIVDAMRPDGMIRSVHFLPIAHPQHGENWMWPFDNPEFGELFEVVGTERVWEIYMATLLDAIEKLPGHIVAHFYVPAKFGHWPDDETLEGYEDRLLDACAERGMAVEVNSRYIYKFYAGDEAQLERFRSAHLRLLRKAKAKGVAVAVGSDAHSPKDQGRAFDAVLALLDEAEINEIAFPINGRMARVALRATEEILRQASAAAAHPAPEPVTASANGSNAPAAEAPAPVAVAAGSGETAAASHGASGLDSEASDDAPAAPADAVKVAKKRPPRKRTAPATAAGSDAETAPAAVEESAPVAGQAVAEAAVAPLPEAEPAADEPAAAEQAVDEPAAEEPGVAEVAVAQAPAAAIAVPEGVDLERTEPVAAESADAEHADAMAAEAPETVAAVAAPAAGIPAPAAEEPVRFEALEPEPEDTEATAARAEPAEEPVAGRVAPLPDAVTRPKTKPRSSPRSRPAPAPARTATAAAAAAKPSAKPAAKSAATKSRPAKSAALKPVAKKATPARPAAKPAAKKAAPKTAASKKSSPRPVAKPAKKAVAKKAAGARTAPAKAAKKAPPKRAAPAKKSSAKKTVKKKAARARR